MRSVADVENLRTRPTRMDDGINPFEHRDVDCSGRSLATLLVAWVGAAMVASVLLRWKYMWIALTILTLLFLFACGYAACNAKRAQERAISNEEARILQRRSTDGNIQSVSGSVDSILEAPDPPAYQAYWITDLPPPYAVVIGAEPPPLIPRSNRSIESEPTISMDGPRLSNPPPYSVAILSDEHVMQTIPASQTNRGVEATSPTDEPTNSQRERVLGSDLAWDQDKNTSVQSSNSGPNLQTVRPSGAQYLSNIISCTFGIGQRRNAERNSSANTASRDWPETFESTATTISIQRNATSAHRPSATSV